MPVPEQTPVNSSVGNGVTTVFPYEFKILVEEDLVVEFDGVVVSDSLYSVSDVGVDGGGNVTFSTAPEDGVIVTRYRNMAIERQDIDYQEGGGFEAETVDEDMDRAVMLEQERALAIKRAPKAPRSVSTDQVITEEEWADRAGCVWGFDATGQLVLLPGQAGTSLVDLAAGIGASLIGYTPSGTGAQAQSVSIWMKGKVKSIFDFIPPAIHDAIRAGTDSTDLRTYIQAAYAATPLIEWGPGVFNFSDEIDLSGYTDGVAIIGPGECSGPSFYGFGAKLVHTGTNKKGFILPPGSNHVEGIYAAYSAQQSAANTSSVLIELLNADRTKLRNLRLFYANTLIGMRQGVTNTLFNSDLTNLDLNQASLTDLDLRNVSGGGTNTKLNNIYFNGGGSLDFVTAGQSCSYAIRTAGWSGLEVHGVSFDGMEFTERLWDSSNDEGDVPIIRAEAVKCKKDNDGWFTFGGSYNKMNIGHINIAGCRALLADCATASYVVRLNATTNNTKIGSMFFPTNANSSYTTPIFRPATIGSTNGPVRVGRITEGTSVLTSRTWTGTSFAGVVEEWDGRLVNEVMLADRGTNTARRIPATSSSLPTGTATGDVVPIVNPGDLGRPSQYVDFGGTLYPSGFVGGENSVTTINDELDFTLTPGTSRPRIRHTGVLTSDVDVTLSTSGAWNGAMFKITRTGAGAFNLNVGTGPLKAMATNTWAEFTYDGGAWRLMEYGAL